MSEKTDVKPPVEIIPSGVDQILLSPVLMRHSCILTRSQPTGPRIAY